MSKPYMPLMMGDWIKGTRGMRADVKGVYIGLLIHQYDHGYVPADLEELYLIEPEVVKVWVKLKEKFEEFEPGKLRNRKLEEVRDFWNKQSSNGKKGGRPKNDIPKENPNHNPEINPKGKLHNDPDLDTDYLKLKEYDGWTEKILDGSDAQFEAMFMNERIPPSEHIKDLVVDHRDLLSRYPRMRPPDQNAFRRSCIKHIKENLNKARNGTRSTDKATIRRSDATIERGREFGSL